MKLQDYLYLETDHHKALGWARTEEQFLDLVNALHWHRHMEDCTDTQRNLAGYVYRTCQSYYKDPTHRRENVRYAVRQADSGLFFIEPMENMQGNDNPGIMAVFSPMMFKGLDCQLATVNLSQQDHIYVHRINELVAMPERAYISLLKNDAESVQRDGWADLRRRSAGRKATGAEGTLWLNSGDARIPLADITKRSIQRAMQALTRQGVRPVTDIDCMGEANQNPFEVTLEYKCDAFLDFIDRLQSEVPQGIITTSKQTAWQHLRSGNIFIGSYPQSFGYHERVCERVGCIYPNIISGRNGVALQFHNKNISYVITRE